MRFARSACMRAFSVVLGGFIYLGGLREKPLRGSPTD